MSGTIVPEVSIVIPTRSAGERLRDLLAAIRAQETRRSIEVVAFDSGSTDDTVKVLREGGCRVTEIPPSDFNHGLTRNQAIASSRGGLVILLTQDAVPADRSWLEALLAPFEDAEVNPVQRSPRAWG